MKTTLFPAFCAFTSLLWVTISSAKGGSELGVPFTLTEAKLSTTSAGYSFALKLDDKGCLQRLSATYKDKEFVVPKDELPALDKVDLGQADLTTVTTFSAGGALESIILIIPYSPELRKDPDFAKLPAEHHSDAGRVSDMVRVTNVIRIIFDKGKFFRWEKAISLGEESHAWKLSYKDAGNAEEDNGKEDSLGNPYWNNGESAYWSGK